MQNATLRLAIIVGSNRTGRFAPTVTTWFAEQAREHGQEVDIVDVAELALPADLSIEDETGVVAAVGERLDRADAFVVVTPEYNHSFPAPLKQLIDNYHGEWQAKPVGFVSYGGLAGGLRAVEQLRQVFAELHAVTVRDGVSFHSAWEQFTEDGRPLDEAGTSGAAKKMLDQLTWWGEALRRAREAHPYAA